MRNLFKTLQYSIRTLRRSLGVTLIATGSLALAIAGNVIVFSLMNGLLWRPLPYVQPDRISLINERALDQDFGGIAPVSAANFLDWQEQGLRSYSAIGAFRGMAFGLDRGESIEQLQGASVTPSFFGVLGSEAFLGRVFLGEEAVSGRDKVAILSHEYWLERYGGGGQALGESLILNGETYSIVGVMGEQFEFLNPNVKIYVPLALDRARLQRHQRDLIVVGRLASDATDDSAKAEMAAVAKQQALDFPEANRGIAIDVLNLRHEIPDRRNRLFFGMMQGAMLFVLLIACANIANLLLARGQKREREMAVRSSLGASRSQIFGQLFSESLVMAFAAGIAGLALGWGGNYLVAQSFANLLPKMYSPVIDQRVIAVTLGVTFFGGCLFSLAPLLQTFRSDLLGSLKDGTKASASGRKRWMSSALVVGELALALIFLAGAGILLRSFQILQSSDPGFETEALLTVPVSLPESRYPSPEEQFLIIDRMGERLAALPGVEASLVSSSLPRNIFVPGDVFSIDGAPPAPDEAPLRTDWLTVDEDYFLTLGITQKKGRDFSRADSLSTSTVAVINEAMADKFFAGEDPLGRRITFQGSSREIVGIVANVRHGLSINDQLAPVAYLPISQAPSPSVAFALRVTGVDPMSLAETVSRELRDIDPHLSVGQVQTLDDFIDQFWAGQRIFSLILQSFGGLALLLAALGTYGVLAYSVAQRRQEIGIRMAIGADRRSVVNMVLRQGMILASLGFALGIPGVFLVNRGLQSVLDGFVPVELAPVASGGSVLLVVTLLASLIPAWRASSIDPATALREE